MSTTDPSDPRDLDDYLDAFGDRLRAATVVPDATSARPSRRRRRSLAVAVVAVAGVVVTSGALLGSGPAGQRLDVVEKARAALAPSGEIVHTVITASYPGPRGANTVRTEQWATADPSRWRLVQVIPPPSASAGTADNSTGNVFDAEGPIQGRQEVAYADGEQRVYLAERDTLRITQGFRDDEPAAGLPRPLGLPGGDPAADLRTALASGQVSDEGEQQVDGRTVRRLVSRTSIGEMTRILTYDVDPDTYAPVAGELRLVRARGKATLVTGFRVDTYERLALDDETAKLLMITTTPATRVTVITADEVRERERRLREGCVPLTSGDEKCPATPRPGATGG